MYSKISSIYNIFKWHEFSQDLFKRLEFFLYEWKINTHYDMACGTGEFSYLVKKAGVDSVGGDISPEMIKKAKNNYPQLKYEVSDMRDISLKKKVDLITCNFDSINHLLRFSDWVKTFKSVYNNLEEGGRFLFDVNTLYIINNYKDTDEVLMDGFKLNINIYPRKNNILVFDIESSELNEKNSKIKEVVKETSFEYKKIKKTLKNIGFKKVVIFNDKLGVKNTKKRLYILAEK